MMMKTRWFVLSMLMMACGGGGGATAPGTSSNPGTTGTTAGANGMISIKSSSDSYGYSSFSFDPGDVTIAKGATVTWSNGTGVAHNVTFSTTSGAPVNVDNFSSGAVTRTFATAGTFDFHCTNHSGMSGTITVQ